MDLYEKIRSLPTQPGVYLYKNADNEVIYVGKAKNLRSRVRSYLLEAAQADAKTGSLMRQAVDLEYILVGNEQEALALEDSLIKQRQPRFNILLRDDKTYPYVKLTMADRFPKVFVTRRLRKDGSAYFGPYFPGNLAWRVVELIHRSFLIPSCKIDLCRYHPRACLQYYMHRCLGPCVEGLTNAEEYAIAIRDARLLLEGRHTELERTLSVRMMAAAEAENFEAAARFRDQLSTVRQLQEKQRVATTEQNDDTDVFGYHFEAGSLAVNLFHVRAGKIVDRREFFWENLPELLEASDLNVDLAPKSPEEEGSQPAPQGVLSALLKQLYIGQQYVPRCILVPVDFDDRESLAALLSERTGRHIEIAVPQRGDKKSLIGLAGQNARQSYIQRFRVLEPSRKAIQEALADLLMLAELPRRIECFDISHIQGAETVASLVVWEDGKMNKQAYRKFQIKTVAGVDDFASMREVVHRRYKRLLDQNGDDQTDNSQTALPKLSRSIQLCGVRVLLDEEPVPLIYVSVGQINFVVPGARQFGEKVVIRVVRTGASSIPVSLKFGPDRMWLYQEEAAYTGMPVWVRIYNVSDGKRPVELPFGIPLMWPSAKCPHIEVKFNDAPLPELTIKIPPRQLAYSGPACPSPPVPDRQTLAGRIPLHLRYRMDRPGTVFRPIRAGARFFRDQAYNRGNTVDDG